MENIILIFKSVLILIALLTPIICDTSITNAGDTNKEGHASEVASANPASNFGCKSLRESLSRNVLMEEIARIDQSESYRVPPGSSVRFHCPEYFTLSGPSFAVCQPNGRWKPAEMPSCWNMNTEKPKLSVGRSGFDSNIDKEDKERSCSPLQLGRYGKIVAATPGVDISGPVPEGTLIEAACFTDVISPEATCMMHTLRCIGGEWRGRIPDCSGAWLDECPFPPDVTNGELESVDGGVGAGRFGVGGTVSYACLGGYRLVDGSSGDLTCHPGGCWQSDSLDVRPLCQPDYYPGGPPYYSWLGYALRPGSPILFSLVVSLCALLTLASATAFLIAACRRRHHHHPQSGVGRGRERTRGGMSHPRAIQAGLVAYADAPSGIIHQNSLPSYEEAMRRSYHGVSRANLGQVQQLLFQRCNSNNSSHITRQHLSSAGESMGSTDTVTVSTDTSASGSGSTNVTLDTVSTSNSNGGGGGGSQTASCRGICGSLASFDTSSIILNTDGVPLLEENELEENGGAAGDMCSLGEGSTILDGGVPYIKQNCDP